MAPRKCRGRRDRAAMCSTSTPGLGAEAVEEEVGICGASRHRWVATLLAPPVYPVVTRLPQKAGSPHAGGVAGLVHCECRDWLLKHLDDQASSVGISAAEKQQPTARRDCGKERHFNEQYI